MGPSVRAPKSARKCHRFVAVIDGIPWTVDDRRPTLGVGKNRADGRKFRMQILGIGTDIIECPRIGRMIEQHGELFLRRVYTEREIRYCQSRKHAIEHFAGRWAAKEAILKAIGTGRSHGISWTSIEVRTGSEGRPTVMVCGTARETTRERGIADILISISHCRTYATAYAMALGRQTANANSASQE